MDNKHGEEVYKQLVETVRGYFYSVQYSNEEIKAIYHSPQCEAITGHTPEEFGHDFNLWSKIIHPDDLDVVLEFFSKPSENAIEKPICHRIIHKDGQIRWISNCSVVSKNLNGKVISIEGLITDITERKQIEKSLVEAKERAEAVTALMDNYVALVSHDLRSPLSSIMFSLSLLQKRIGEKIHNFPLNEVINSVQSIALRQIEMIDRLLDVSLVHTGHLKPQIELVAVRDIVSTQIGYASLHGERKGVAIHNETPEGRFVSADEVLFGQVIQNLLINAVKFCNKGDTVTVSMPLEDIDVIEVRDTGIGISTPDILNLFNRKVNAPSLGTANERGSGLGLPYCLKIMQGHGGDLWAESKLGEGSAFFCKLTTRPVA